MNAYEHAQLEHSCATRLIASLHPESRATRIARGIYTAAITLLVVVVYSVAGAMWIRGGV